MNVDEIIAELRKLSPDELEDIRDELCVMEFEALAERPHQPLPDTATLAERDGLDDLVGCIEDLPEDLAVNIDHYLYGVRKRC